VGNFAFYFFHLYFSSLQLGVCNPNLAYSIYQHDENVALLLPCTVTIQKQKDDKIKIQVADPIQMLTKIDDGSHPSFKEVAQEAETRLIKVLDSMQ
jgi:uncharacterized protein (DUF302 family)